MKINKHVKEFNKTGCSLLNIDLVCKNWNDRFTIYTWINDDKKDYTFVINSKVKDKVLVKTKILESEALIIANRLKLIHVKDVTFSSAGSFRTEKFIISEISRLETLNQEKRYELDMISKMIYMYEISL